MTWSDVAVSDTPEPEPLDPEPVLNYWQARNELELTMRRAVAVSKGAANRKAGERCFWASVLYVRLVVTGKSALVLAPKISVPKGEDEHWDYSSLASLTRNVVECYLLFFWLTVENVTDDERHMRINLTHLRDNETRKRMMADFGHSPEKLSGFDWHRGYLTERIKSQDAFKALDEKRQRELLKADRAPYVQDDLVAKLGLNRSEFRGYYRYISSHTHTDPLSFYRMAERGSGTGVKNPVDMKYMASALNQARYYIDRATVDMGVIFPDLVAVAAAVTLKPAGNRQQRRGASRRGK